MPRPLPKPHYYEDKPIDSLLAEIEEIISSSRDMARDMDAGRGVVKNSIAIRKQLVYVGHLIHSLRKEVVERKKRNQAERRQGYEKT